MTQHMFGPYRLGPRLGRGAMGVVHEAFDTVRGRTVALKRMTADDPDLERRFRRESRIAAQLSSPHVIPIHDFGVIEDELFLDMRLVRGTDLGRMIETSGPLLPARAATIVAQIADALDAAHAAGLVHRDVKPSNALVTSHRGRDFVYLADFGIVHETDPAEGRLTATGSTLGTPAYMAPEQLRAEPIDGRVDVYALGCVLFEMLTGRTPFVGESLAVLYSHHLSSTPKPPSRFREGLPTELDTVVLAALEKDPDRRPESAGDLAEAALRASAPASPRPRTPAPGTARPPTVERPPSPTLSVDAAPAAARPWNTAAIASVVLGVLLPVLGIAAGVLGLRQTASHAQRGRALAWAGIVVGSLLSLATVVVVVVYLSLTPSVSTATIETQIARRTGVAVDAVQCGERLPAEIGSSVTCTVGEGPDAQTVRATTTAVRDTGTDFSLTAE